MQRASCLALLLLIACDKGERAKPPPAKRDAAVAIDAEVISEQPPPGPPEVDYQKIEERERRLPEQRKPCKPSCALPNHGSDLCSRSAGRLQVIGFSRNGNICNTTQAIIDCCPAISVADRQAVTRALGWERADVWGRLSIAWSIAYAVEARTIIDNPVNGPPDDQFDPPTATISPGNEITLDYWFRTESSADAHFVHEQLVVHRDGRVAKKQLADLAPVAPHADNVK